MSESEKEHFTKNLAIIIIVGVLYVPSGPVYSFLCIQLSSLKSYYCKITKVTNTVMTRYTDKRPKGDY